MTGYGADDAVWAAASERIAAMLGLHFPRERWSDLRRGLQAAAPGLGVPDALACAAWLARSPPPDDALRVLASHLTIGETYFMRDAGVFEALRERLLPGLLAARRREGTPRLRLWSAGCCTGEEPYSLAIVLRELLPDLERWNVAITATDVNPRFLERAAAGVYGEWSFRGTPPAFRARHFRARGGGRYEVLPEIRRMVRFAPLNLVQDEFPSVVSGTNAMDVVFCRNVLMYFTPAQMRGVVGRLREALLPGGWLVVSPSESSHGLFAGFRPMAFPGAIVHRKPARAAERASSPPVRAACQPAPAAPAIARDGGTPSTVAPVDPAPGPRSFEQHARRCANGGRLEEALGWCDRWIAADKLCAAAHYLRAAVLIEQGRGGDADVALQRTLFLEPRHVMAHLSAAQLARARGHAEAARRHFGNALREARRLPGEAPVPDSDGVSAARLADTVAALAEALA